MCRFVIVFFSPLIPLFSFSQQTAREETLHPMEMGIFPYVFLQETFREIGASTGASHHTPDYFRKKFKNFMATVKDKKRNVVRPLREIIANAQPNIDIHEEEDTKPPGSHFLLQFCLTSPYSFTLSERSTLIK